MIGSRKNYRDGSGVFSERLTELNAVSQHPEWEFYERHFTSERMANYLSAFNGDQAKARALYEWNAQISASFWELLAYLEVALRNTIDRQMTQRCGREGVTNHWVIAKRLDFGRINSHFERHLKEVNDRLSKANVEKTGQRIVSELSFNFWVLMFSKSAKSLWPDLADGFKGLQTRNLSALNQTLSELRNFRNLIGHHHRIWQLDLMEMHLKIIEIGATIEPEFGSWLETKSKVLQLLATRP